MDALSCHGYNKPLLSSRLLCYQIILREMIPFPPFLGQHKKDVEMFWQRFGTMLSNRDLLWLRSHYASLLPPDLTQ